MAWIMDTVSMTRGADHARRRHRNARARRIRGGIAPPPWPCSSRYGKFQGAQAVLAGARWRFRLGNAGGCMASLLHEEGARVVAASDSGGGVHHVKGLDTAALQRHKDGGQSLKTFSRNADHEQAAARAAGRHPGAGRTREPDHRDQRSAHQGQGDRGGATDPPRARGRHSVSSRAHGDPGHLANAAA